MAQAVSHVARTHVITLAQVRAVAPMAIIVRVDRPARPLSENAAIRYVLVHCWEYQL